MPQLFFRTAILIIRVTGISTGLLLMPWCVPGGWCSPNLWDEMRPQSSISFDKGVHGPGQEESVILSWGGRWIRDGVSGGACSLASGECLILNAAKVLNPREGTISVWIRPHWNEEDKASHAFLSFGWRDNRKGYFVLSRGWWEPEGKGFLYLVYNNQEGHSHARTLMRYDPGRWIHMALNWKIGESGFVSLYVNGIPLPVSIKPPRMVYASDGRLYVGSDNGTPLAQNRWADSDFDEIAFFNRALSDEEVLTIYERQLPPTLPESPLPRKGGKEVRAIFDEGTGWMSAEGARTTIQRIAKAGFNVYIPCIWHGRGTRYPSKLAPPEGGAQFNGRDPLAELLKVAHENGIEVHPWFTVALRQREFLQDFFDEGTAEKAFDIQRPAFRTFIVDLILEVVKKYEVDGINLDYIRTTGTCRCDHCQRKYQETTGRSLLADLALSGVSGPLVTHLQQWVDTGAEDIIRRLSLGARAMNPRIQISVDGRPRPQPSREGRQEIRWANEGLVDLIYNMEYGRYPEVENHHFMMGRLAEPAKLVLLLANYRLVRERILPRDPAGVARMVNYAVNRWGNGVGLYLYSALSDEQIQALTKVNLLRFQNPNSSR